MLLSCVADTFIAVLNCHFPSFIFFSSSHVMNRGFTVFEDRTLRGIFESKRNEQM